MKKKYIEYGQFRDAVMIGIEEWLETDITDYDNWQGIREMAHFMWVSLDRRAKGQRKLKLLRPLRIEERVEAEINKRYKHLIGNIYIKN